MTNFSDGRLAEKSALWFLRLKGYRLIEQNYIIGRGTGAGEVDLIMKKGKMLVFVEVKKRENLVAAAYAILPQQQRRIRKTAEVFLAQHSAFENYDVRFDAVLVELPFKILHIENAF